MKKQHLRRLLPILLLLAALILPASGLAEEPPRDVKDLINPPPTASVFQNGEPVTEDGNLTTEPVFVEFAFTVPVKGDDPENPDESGFVKKGDFFRFELSSGFAWESDEYYPLMDGSTIIGHITITTEDDGKVYANVVFDGDDEVFNGTLSGVKCTFWGEFTYNGDGDEDGDGKDTVQILEKDYTIIIPPGEINYKLNKSGAADMATGLVTWTVVVDGVQDGKHIDLSGYTFEDVLSSAGDFVDGSFKVNDVTPTGTDADYDPITKKLTYEFPDGTGDGPKTITYQTQIPQDKYYSGAEETLKNSALLKDKDGDTVKKDAATVTFTPGWISKSGKAGNEEKADGTYNSEGRTLTWTVVVKNPGSSTLTNAVVTENLPSGLTLTGVEINGVDADPPIVPGENNVCLIPVGDIEPGEQVVLTIKTLVLNETYTAGVTTYENSASVSWDGYTGPGEGVGTGGVGVGIGFVPITKSGKADTETGQVTWTVKVDTRGQEIENLIVYDLLVHGKTWDASAVTEWPEGVPTGLTPQFDQKFISGTFSSVDPTNLTITHYPLEGQDADLLVIKELSNDQENTFTFTSQILDPNILAGNARKDVLNTATLYSDDKYLNQATAEVSYFGRVLQKSMLQRDAAKAPLSGTNANDVASQLSEGFNYEDKTVVFRLNVNVNGIGLTSLGSGPITVTDTLPKGWEFVPMVKGSTDYFYLLAGTSVNNGGEIQVAENPTHLTLPSKNFSAAVAGGSATFTFDPLAERYVILLRARPKDERAAILFNDNKTTTETNNVSMETKNWTGYKVEDTQSVTVDSKLVGKSAAVNKDAGFATWTLDYRPYDIEASFPDDTAYVYLTDEIPEGVELRTDAAGNLRIDGNIKVYQLTLKDDGTYVQGDEITPLTAFDITYDNVTRVLRIEIPEKDSGYRFTYITDITGNPGKKVTNEVMLIGKSEKGTLTSASFNISTSGASGEVGRRGGNLSIKKYDALTQNLPGIPFTLYGSKDNGVSYSVRIRSGVTDAQGELTLQYIPGPTVVGDTAVYELREGALTPPLDTYYDSLPVYTVEVKRESLELYTTTVKLNGVDVTPVEGPLPIRNLDSVDTSLCQHVCPQGYAPDLDSSNEGGGVFCITSSNPTPTFEV